MCVDDYPGNDKYLGLISKISIIIIITMSIMKYNDKYPGFVITISITSITILLFIEFKYHQSCNAEIPWFGFRWVS